MVISPGRDGADFSTKATNVRLNWPLNENVKNW